MQMKLLIIGLLVLFMTAGCNNKCTTSAHYIDGKLQKNIDNISYMSTMVQFTFLDGSTLAVPYTRYEKTTKTF